VTQEKRVVFSYSFVKFGTFVGFHVAGRFIIIIIIITITLVLQPASSLDRPNEASPFHSVRHLGLPVVNCTFVKVFLNAVHPYYRGRPTCSVPSVFVNDNFGGWIVRL
jgi:hypothetical protein